MTDDFIDVFALDAKKGRRGYRMTDDFIDVFALDAKKG
jgi:hypothetical protein